MKCDYGCNSEAPYTLKNGKHCCHENYQQCPTLRAKNSQGIKKCIMKERDIIFQLMIEINHLKNKYRKL